MNFVNAFLNSIWFHEFITKVLLDGYSFDLFNTKFAIVNGGECFYNMHMSPPNPLKLAIAL